MRTPNPTQKQFNNIFAMKAEEKFVEQIKKTKKKHE